MIINKSNICPCGKYRAYKACCGKIHIHITEAVSAEDLMRSRYSAFTMGMGIYLNESHCISTRNELEINNIEKWAKSVKWIRLEILNSTLGTLNDLEGTVEFKAYFKEGLINKVIHENSKFIKTDNIWFYHSAL
jgi:SEC-C motif-containing protein|tara:strand:+ start:1486 stop:1887 length:402 start_codon:yes stop_codon:yes gene_type:complete